MTHTNNSYHPWTDLDDDALTSCDMQPKSNSLSHSHFEWEWEHLYIEISQVSCMTSMDKRCFFKFDAYNVVYSNYYNII